MDELEEFRTWLKSYSEEGVMEEFFLLGAKDNYLLK